MSLLLLRMRRAVLDSHKMHFTRVTDTPAPERIVTIEEVNEPRVDYNERGEITQISACPIGTTLDHAAAGQRCLPYAGRPWDQWVDTSGPKPVLADRPVVELRPSTATPRAGEEVSLPDIPACTVYFEGPASGEQVHDGEGPLEIGWRQPGTYTLYFDTFPHLVDDLVLEVQP